MNTDRYRLALVVAAVGLVLGVVAPAAVAQQDCSAEGSTCSHEQDVSGIVEVSLKVTFNLLPEFGYGSLLVGDNVKPNVGTIDIQSNTDWTLGVRGGVLSVQRNIDTDGDGTAEWNRVCDDGSTFDHAPQVGCGSSTKIPTTLDRLSVVHANGTPVVVTSAKTPNTVHAGSGSELVDTLDVHLTLQADDRATAPLEDTTGMVRWRAGREFVQGDLTDRALPVVWHVAAS